MDKQYIKRQLKSFALSMFRKDFFGIYHGSLSAKLDTNLFTINTKNAIFDSLSEENLIDLFYNRDYRWKDASIDASIHHGIYRQISDAKYITFTMPPFTTAFSLNHSIIIPKDYFGHKEFGKITIYDPKKFDDWYERAVTEIPQYFQQHQTAIMVIRGYGVYAYARDIHTMVRQLSVLERSCRILMLDRSNARLDMD
ncbi:MAG: class II aldolase and adducin N-terminal domain-containing protein [Sulfuricurvum sp.]